MPSQHGRGKSLKAKSVQEPSPTDTDPRVMNQTTWFPHDHLLSFYGVVRGGNPPLGNKTTEKKTKRKGKKHDTSPRAKEEKKYKRKISHPLASGSPSGG